MLRWAPRSPVKWVCDPFVDDRDRFVPYTHGLGGPCYAGRFTSRKMVCDPFGGERDRFVPYTHGLGGPCYAPKPTLRIAVFAGR